MRLSSLFVDAARSGTLVTGGLFFLSACITGDFGTAVAGDCGQGCETWLEGTPSEESDDDKSEEHDDSMASADDSASENETADEGGESSEESSDIESSEISSDEEESSSTITDDPTSDSSNESDTCNNGVVDGNESDVDCGGECSGCENDRECRNDHDCLSQHCFAGTCADEGVECRSDDECPAQGPCAKGQCLAGQCQEVALADDTPCDDENACTLDDHCISGKCVGLEARPLVATFGTDGEDWTFVSNNGQTFWEIGPAKTSSCDQEPPLSGGDPDQDASDSAVDPKDGLAGTVIGGCVLPIFPLSQGCVVSPAFSLRSGLQLSFEQQRHFESAEGAGFSDPGWHAKVSLHEIGANSSIVVHTVDPSHSYDDANWVQHVSPVPVIDESVRYELLFCFSYARGDIGQPSLSSGWSIDDVLIAPPGCAL